jgi:hypothetical protein
MVFTKLKSELATLAQPVPVPMGCSAPDRDHGGQGIRCQDSNFPCPRLPVPDDSPKLDVGTTAGRAGSYASPALPENSAR